MRQLQEHAAHIWQMDGGENEYADDTLCPYTGWPR